MAITDLSGKKRKQALAQGVKERNFARSQKSNGNVQAKKITYTKEKEAPVNAGGNFFAGAGYLGEKLAAGFVQTVEGAWDYLSGTATQAFGDLTNNQAARDTAYGIFNNQWWDGEFYQHADKWYNPDNGMKVAGDVAGGIGTSLPAIAANFANFAVPGLGTGLSIGVAGLGAAGNATSEAVQQTGSLDWSKIGYGAMVGATEGGIEYLSSKIGVGTGRIMKNISDTAVGKAASQLTKRGMFNLAKELGKDFVSEAAEEAVAEIMAPVYARMTYDPDAELASAEQVWYAAFVGGMSGILMGGAGDAVNAAKSRVIGGNITKNQGEMDKVLRNASRIAELYDKGGIDSDTMKSVSDTYQKLQASMAKSKDGEVTSYQKKLVGDLAQLNTAATFETYAAQRAYDIVQNIDAFVEKASAYKYTDPEGNPITVTKEALLKGVEIDKNGNVNRKSLIKAIRNNRDLQYFALMDMAGRMQMDTAAFTKASMEGVTGANDLDIARYLEQASPEQKAQLASALGYDTLDAVSADDFNARVAAYAGSSKYQNAKRIMEASEARRNDKTDGKIPKRFAKKDDGTYVFESDGNKIAVTKEGDTYSVYDYTTEEAVTDLSKTELNRMLGKYAETHAIKHSAETITATETTEAKPKAKKTDADVTADVEAFASERVKGYSKLLPAEKTLVRRVIRQGRTMGVADDILSAYANVCAHAKILVQFKRGIGTKNAQGEFVESNGYYDRARNVIVANPNATNGVGRVLIHELDHAIRTGAAKGGKDTIYFDAIKGVDEKTRKQILDQYGIGSAMDETNAYYAETVLSAEATVERLVAEKPTLKQTILSFFKGAETDYKDVPFLDTAAESYYQKYKKMFDKFAKRNAGGLISSVSERNVRAIRPSNALGVKHNLALVNEHRAKLEKKYESYDLKEYDLAVDMFKSVAKKLDSEFLKAWNAKDGKNQPFTVFKEQSGYPFNAELSTECVKGIALFEAIDAIVQRQISDTVGDAGIHIAEKQLLYDLLHKRGFQIPCAICYVEQARQREGIVIERFLNGTETKLGWNQVLDKIETLMAEDGNPYTFGSFSRMIATDGYTPAEAATMTDAQDASFKKAFRQVANEYIDQVNEQRKEERKALYSHVENMSPAAVEKVLKKTGTETIKLLRAIYLDPAVRLRFPDDVLYSSLTTLNLATSHNDVFKLFNALEGQAGYKTKQAQIVYWGDILNKKYDKSKVRKKGGLRIQSNSDFQLYSFLDYVQMFVDLSAKGQSLHAYTKTLTQLKLFGLSGGKINASLIPRVKVYRDANGNVDEAKTMENAGLDENGNPIYDDVEGIPHEEAFMLLEDPEYSKNCAGICIGYSDKHIAKLLDDPHVQLIIGFHDTTSDTSKRYRGAKYSTNYNGFNEAVKVVSNDKFKTVHLSFNEFIMQAEAALGYNVDTRKAKKESIEYNGKTYKVDDIPRLAVAMYLQYCADHNMLPAYSRTGIDFSKHPNYYKLLGDYGLYDSQGHYAPQGAVSYKLPEKIPYLTVDGKKAYLSTKKYLKGRLKGELAVRESLAKMLKDDGEGSFMDEYTKGAKAIRENGGRYAPKVEPQVDAPTISIVPANARKSLPLSAHATAAVEEFGTTGEFRKAGFVLPDGRMLNLSPNGIGVNHKQIERVMDVKGEAAVAAFINEGNVRVKDAAPGIEIGTEVPVTVSQLNIASRFISKSLRERGMLYLDITDPSGKSVASATYEEGTSASEVVYDIKDYYERGTVPVGSDGRRFSLVGVGAKTADTSKLNEARKMASEGVDSETIRKKTGWFQGYDTEWRFEIDDSVAEWHLDTAKPDSKRLFEFGERIFKLTDLLDHPALYAAYPELRNVTVWENPSAKTGGYIVGRSTDHITVRSLENREINKDILIHEIQHLIQNIEGFAPGASIDQFSYKAWGEAEYAAYEKRNEIAKKLYAVLRRHGVSITKQEADAVRTSFDTRDSIIDYNFMLIESLADANKRTRMLLDEYWKQVQILNLTTPDGQYHAVAGEVEAYDVQARRRMTAEQRKNTRPNIDRTDVIVADGDGVYYSAKSKNAESRTASMPRYESRQGLPNDSTSKPIVSQPSADVNPSRKFSLPLTETDRAYMDAVENGEMETAQKMVDEAAKEAGYGVTTYHGTDKDFTVFKTLFYNEFGYHVGTKKSAEDRVKYNLNSKVLKLYTKLGKTIRTPDVFGYFAGMHDYIFYVRGEVGKVSDMDFLKQNGRTKKLGNKFPHTDVLDRLHNAYVEFVESGYKHSKGAAVVELTQEYLKGIGVDSVAYSNAYEAVGSTSYLLMNPNQVKSADPVTYADDGSIIPLSERFNKNNPDIRYSLPLDGSGDVARAKGVVSALAKYESNVYFERDFLEELRARTGDAKYTEILRRWHRSAGRYSDNAKMLKFAASIVEGLWDIADMDAVSAFIEMDKRYTEALDTLKSNGISSEDVVAEAKLAARKQAKTKKAKENAPKKSEGAERILGVRRSPFNAKKTLKKFRGYPTVNKMSVGEIKKIIANNTKMRVYSKKEVLEMVNKFTNANLVKAKTINEVANNIWQLLNDAPDPDYRDMRIRQTAEFIAAKFMTSVKLENPNIDAEQIANATYLVNQLDTYLKGITFGDDFLAELGNKTGTKTLLAGKTRAQAIINRWGAPVNSAGVGTPIDVMLSDVLGNVKGFEGISEMSAVDALLYIDSKYREAKQVLKKQNLTWWEADKGKAETLIQEIARDIRQAFDSGGERSTLANILGRNTEYYIRQAQMANMDSVEAGQYNNLYNRIVYLANRMKDLKADLVNNATQGTNHPFKGTFETLSGIIRAEKMLTPAPIRQQIAYLHAWYVSKPTKDLLGYKSDEDPGVYSDTIAAAMETIALAENQQAKFSVYEMQCLDSIMSHAIAIVKNYQKVWKNGKLVDALPEAEKYIETMQKSLSVKVNAVWEKVYSGFLWQFGTPVDVMAHADKFMEGGFFSEMLQTLRDAAENAAIEEMNVLKEHDAFIDQHKHYVRESTETKVKFRGQEIPKQTLITLYMTAKREHAWAGLIFNGAQYKIGNLEVKVKPLTTAEELTYNEMQATISEAQGEMEKLLTETDKEYIAILEKGYNATLKEIKIKRDMERLGFTNAMDSYYIPLKRANMATTIDQQFLPINTASNSSFNKNTVRGAAQALELVAAEDLFLRHAHEVCQYAYLSPAIESFDVLWNIDTAGNRNNPTSLKTVYHAANPEVVANRKSEKRENAKRGDMEGYFRELIQDIQGTKRGESNKWISALRGGYATFQLGLNTKVLFTQISSIFASISEIDAGSVFGMGANFFSPAGKDVDLYCPLAELRNYDNTAASAQAVMDMRSTRTSEGLQRIRDISMKGIGMMDRFVVMKVFVACQKHVAKHQGLEFGTEANKIAAGKLLKTVIEQTQQGSLATEKSKAARGGEIMKTFTMFRSDAIKVMGRVLTSAGNLAVKIQVAKSMKANAGAYTAEQIAKAEADVKAAGKKFGKSMAALVSVSAFMTFVSWLFRYLYNKDEDKPEEELIKTAITFGGSFLGGLPIISDIYSSFVEGFAIENFALGAANDLVEAIKGVGTLIVNSAQGKASSQDWMRGTRDIVYAVCSIMGLPVRNLWNAVSGTIRRVNSGAGKAIDNVFYPTYASEFKEAIEAGDDSKAYMIMQILTGDRLDGADSAVVNGFNSLNQRLLKQNKDIILPADCPASITVGGKKIEFTTAEQAKIQQRFASKAESDFKKLFASEAYKSMTAAQKRAAVAAINSARLHECIEYATNKDTGDTNILGAKAVTFSTFAQYKGIINGIESDKDKDGNTISGSKRAKVVAAIKKLKVSDEQKLFLIMVSGYTVKAGDFAGISEKSAKKRVASFIAGLSSLTKAEKEELAKKCGFEVKNGVIQTK